MEKSLVIIATAAAAAVAVLYEVPLNENGAHLVAHLGEQLAAKHIVIYDFPHSFQHSKLATRKALREKLSTGIK